MGEDIDGIWPKGNIPYRGQDEMDPKKRQKMIDGHLAYEAQLRFTAEQIDRVLTTHPHYTDDCGDELRNNLDLSLYLTNGRIDGMEGLMGALGDLLNPDHDMYIGNFVSYASDGLMKYCESQGFRDE